MIKLNKSKFVSIATTLMAFSFLFGDVTQAYAADNHDYKVGDTVTFYENNVGDNYVYDQIVHNFDYSSSSQSFTIQVPGNYDISAYGAAGADYNGLNFAKDETVSYTGGTGGIVSGVITLKAGDVVTVTTGKIGGGGHAYTSSDTLPSDPDLVRHVGKGSNGGGATTVKVNGVTVMVAGGGGGASAIGNGGAAGTGSVTTGTKGESGLAGGGDGYKGGAATQFELHEHEGDPVGGGGCYIIPSLHHHTGDSVNGGGCYTIPVYHSHVYVDENGNIQPANPSSPTIYSLTNPGGCYVAAGHTHNATGTCPRILRHVSFYRDVHERDDNNNEGKYCIIGRCPVCDNGNIHVHNSNYQLLKKYYNGEILYYHCTPPYNCGSPVNTWVIGCGINSSVPIRYEMDCEWGEDEPVGYDAGCGRDEETFVETSTPAAGGSNYASNAVFNSSLSSGNDSNGKVSLAFSGTSSTFVAPCSGDYSFESCDASLTSQNGGAFSGKIHLNAGDVVTMVLGKRGSLYEVHVNGETILKYHYHRGYGVHKTDADNPIQYTESNPGGCYVAAGHEHNKTRTCIFYPEIGHHPTKSCGRSCTKHTTWVGGDNTHHDGPTHGQNSDMDGGGHWASYYTCPVHGGSDSSTCHHKTTDYSRWIVDRPAYWGCYNNPPNIWKLGCGYYDAQAIYSNEFYDVKLDAERLGKAYCRISLYKIDYDILVKPNGGYWNYNWTGNEKITNRTEALAKDQTVKTQTGTVVHIPNPKREGFTFMGWDITDMDTGKHYYAKSLSDYRKVNTSQNVLMESVSAMSTDTDTITYKDVTNEYLYFMDLRIFNGTCTMKAIWMDDSESELNDDWGNFGATFRNKDVVGDGQLVRNYDHVSGNRTAIINTPSLVTSNTGTFLNPDSGLALSTQNNSYSITRRLCDLVLRDGFDNWNSSSAGTPVYQENAIYNDVETCTYNRIHSKYAYNRYILGLHQLGNGLYASDDEVFIGQYPYVYGVTEDGQRYYPGTWTNKSVVIKATAYDGVIGTGDDKVYNRNGGTGVYRMKFEDYSRLHDDITTRESDDWIYNDKPVYTDSTKDSSMTIEKTLSASGIYQVAIKAEDRAGVANNDENGWIANPKGNNVSTVRYGYSGQSNDLDMSTAILIDKDAPVVMDPENYINESASNNSTVTNVWGSMSYARAKAMMYEGYNEIVDPTSDEKDAFGWSMDYVRVVVYADDGNGSGIDYDDAAFCWVPDGSGINYKNPANWQSADSTRNVNGKVYPVSTKTISEKESGYVYVRDAVGNWARIRYNADHFDKQDPDAYPEKDPDAENNDPLPPDPLDPDDPDNKDYNPIPDGEYNFESSLATNELKYDWINHDATVSFKSIDYAVSDDNKKGDVDGKYGSSGIYKMTLYRSDPDFPTKTETLRNGKVRERADSSLYGSETKVAEVTFKDQLKFKEDCEGINYYWLEVLDKANNLTMVKLTVKIDKTFPGIPYKSDTEGDGVGISNGGSANGNDLLSNFGTGKYWTIDQVDLNQWGVDEIEMKIQNEDNMKCTFEFNIYDRNYSGKYAKNSDNMVDDSGFDSVTLKLIDADNDSSYQTYVLYDYADASKIGTSSVGHTFDTAITEKVLTNENSVPYLSGDLNGGTPYAMLHTVSKINTFTDFPSASALNYEIEIIDRAGNVKTYSNEPGNEIRNFSIKAVMHSSEDEEFNEQMVLEQENIAENDADITRMLYLYHDRRGNEYVSNYKLSAEEASRRGLTEDEDAVRVWTGKATSSILSESTALTNVPYYQLGDLGYVEIWTVGYVPEVQFNFGVLGDEIGSEMAKEIDEGRIPKKYELGVYGNSESTEHERVIPCSAATEISVPYASSYGGVPFASHYGVNEAADFENPAIDTQRRWLETGTSIRMPLYYELKKDGGYKSDGTPTYESELHSAAFYAWKGNWKDTSTSSYVIYDTRADDIHYRITHEG